MLFNSLAFLVYFPLVLLIFHLSPKFIRNWCLLVSSLVFYGYGTPWHLFLIFFVIVAAYGGSRLIETRPANKKILLVLTLILLLAPLASFKYLPFACDIPCENSPVFVSTEEDTILHAECETGYG